MVWVAEDERRQECEEEEAAEEEAAERGRGTEVRSCERLSLWLVLRILEHWLNDIHRG